ncbi:MAG: DUF1775 domain-containing protein [Beijerinckiaceae bacterium]
MRPGRASIAPLAGAVLFFVDCAAHAHVGFVKRQVPLAGSIDSILRVPHGCGGSATVRLRMRLPKQVTAVRTKGREGWSISVTVHNGAREIAWSGLLPARQTGEFGFAFDLDGSVKPGDVLYFPVVQECEKGVARWIDVKGKPSADAPDDEEHDENTSPAPSIRILPRK